MKENSQDVLNVSWMNTLTHSKCSIHKEQAQRKYMGFLLK